MTTVTVRFIEILLSCVRVPSVSESVLGGNPLQSKMDIVKTASEGTCTSLSYGEGLYLEVSGSKYTDFQNMGEGEGYQYSSELKIERVNYYISYYISIWRHTHPSRQAIDYWQDQRKAAR